MKRLVWLVVAALLLGVTPAAADPTKQQCVVANEAAQDLQRAKKLIEARQQLTLCIATSCPAAVREDCAQKLDEVSREIPTVIFAAKHGRDDLSAVRVQMDGVELVDHLDGSAVPVNPGEHRFSFEAEGFAAALRTVIVRTGEKDRIVDAELQSLERPSAPVTPPLVVSPKPNAIPKPPEPARSKRSLAPAIASFVVAAAGAVVGGVFTALWVQAKQDGDAACGTPLSCDPATANGWESEQRDFSIALGVGFGVAAVGLGLGVVLLVAGHPTTTQSAFVIDGRGVRFVF